MRSFKLGQILFESLAQAAVVTRFDFLPFEQLLNIIRASQQQFTLLRVEGISLFEFRLQVLQLLS